MPGSKTPSQLVGCTVTQYHSGGYTYHFTISNFNIVSRMLTLQFLGEPIIGAVEAEDEIYAFDNRKWPRTCICAAHARLPALRVIACPYCRRPVLSGPEFVVL